MEKCEYLLDQSLDFYCNKLGLTEVRRYENEKGRFTLIFLAAPDDIARAERDEAPVVFDGAEVTKHSAVAVVLPPDIVELRLGDSRGVSQEHFEPGQDVFQEGDVGDRVYINIAKAPVPTGTSEALAAARGMAEGGKDEA